MVHFVRAPTRAAAEDLASALFCRHKPLCVSSRHIPGAAELPAWKVETIDCFGEAWSSARPVALMNWRGPRH